MLIYGIRGSVLSKYLKKQSYFIVEIKSKDIEVIIFTKCEMQLMRMSIFTNEFVNIWSSVVHFRVTKILQNNSTETGLSDRN